MNGGHQALRDAEIVMHDLRKGRKAVRGAARIGNNVVFRVILRVVYAHHIGRRFGILRRCGKDDLLRAMRKVAGGKLRGVELAGGLNDIFRAAGIPRDVRNAVFAEHGDLMPVDADAALTLLDLSREAPEHGIVFHQIYHIIRVRLAQIDPRNLDLLRPLRRNAQHRSSNAPKTVDPDLNRHACKSSRLHDIHFAFFETHAVSQVGIIA